MWEGIIPVLTQLKTSHGLTHNWGHELGELLPLEVLSSLLFFAHISSICGSWTEFLATN